VNIINNGAIRWKLQGDYFRGCNCKSRCPCIFSRDPDEGNYNVTTVGIFKEKIMVVVVLIELI
jgi:hypothetical protein